MNVALPKFLSLPTLVLWLHALFQNWVAEKNTIFFLEFLSFKSDQYDPCRQRPSLTN